MTDTDTADDRPPINAKDAPRVPVDLLDDGVLWLINRVVFHPRGHALEYDPRDGTFALLGDGNEPVRFAGSLPEDTRFAAVEALLGRARVENRGR